MKQRRPDRVLFQAEDANRPPPYPLLVACEGGDLERALTLIEAGGGHDVNGRDPEGWSPLIMAAKGGYVELLRELLGHGAEVNPPEVSHTALRGACLGGHEQCASILLAAGADPCWPSVGLKTPLMGAAMNGHDVLVACLLKHRADPAAVNDFGETALDLAEQLGGEGCAQLLREASKSSQGRTSVVATQGESPAE